ncbi:hypothetical protein PTTG_30867, partial [Puccinia triticina 1-1 BBBD Race 1]
MSDKNPTSIKLVTEPLNDSNFATWRLKIINALGFQMLDDYIFEDPKTLEKNEDYKTKKKPATTFIRLHLSEENNHRFVGRNYRTYEPKALWDAINSHYATKLLENVANIWDRLYDIRFSEESMKESINLFRNTFDLLLEVANEKLDKPTLETCWVFLILKRLPTSFKTFRTIRFSNLKEMDDTLELSSFLKDLEAELRRQQEAESTIQGTSNATALAVSSSSNQKRPSG